MQQHQKTTFIPPLGLEEIRYVHSLLLLLLLFSVFVVDVFFLVELVKFFFTFLFQTLGQTEARMRSFLPPLQRHILCDPTSEVPQ